MLPATNKRVPEHTADEVNQAIYDRTVHRVHYYSQNTERIADRLKELDHEWDIERMLEANAASLALTGSLLAGVVDRRWVVLPLAVTGFLLQHALQGWCPPLPLLRRLGYRTAHEINVERYALKYLRGDFEQKSPSADAAIKATG
ncbi:MAG: DUF2892 domain-containing protein [Phycisphaeraceae bacterium]|nr:DUF2892 domain-containing protein [Phycisphaeraceae bacterium]